MVVLVCGGRDFPDYKYVCRVLDKIHAERAFTLLVHGDAGRYRIRANRPLAISGADALAGRWADERGIDQVKFPANWNGRSAAAGMYRNRLMLTSLNPSMCIAFSGGRGTANMMRISREAGVELIDTEDMTI